MTDVRFGVEPPAKKKVAGTASDEQVLALVDALKTRPGEWAEVATGLSSPSSLMGKLRKLGCDAQSETTHVNDAGRPDEFRVFALYDGKNHQQPKRVAKKAKPEAAATKGK